MSCHVGGDDNFMNMFHFEIFKKWCAALELKKVIFLAIFGESCYERSNNIQTCDFEADVEDGIHFLLFR